MGSIRWGGRVGAVVCLAAGLVAGCASEERPEGERATVVHVIDGDTLDAQMAGGGGVERVRLPQIDTPERDECGYDDATRLLLDLVLDQDVVLVPTSDGPDRDVHDRLLRAVELDGADVGAELVEAGMARWLSRHAGEDSRLAGVYEEAEDEARREGRGFWTSCGWR
ncbi:thermonuclease family protein [Phytoactinopolyspora limicola]|uniref:thermonuclease family protein n=1 Tax=Phytoactinopolyspora limicola TaxID=2715536 RepID=UPI0014074E6F|nr:thermonuclease family protein [Phytoactinopolyspora limicola]